MAFYSFRFAPGDRILTGRAEYASNWIALRQVAHTTGATIEVVPDDEHGQFDVSALEWMLDERVKLVSLVHVPTQGGLVNPAEAVGRVTRAAGVPLLLDACQSVGQLPLDVEAIGCDILSATGRKFLRGPAAPVSSTCGGADRASSSRRSSTCTRPSGNRTAATRCATTPAVSRTGRPTSPARSALGVAADYALALGVDAIWERVQALARAPARATRRARGLTVRDHGRDRGAIVTFTVDGRRPPTSAPRSPPSTSTSRSPTRVGAPRPRPARHRRAGARVGALLQHRARNRPARRAGGGVTEPIDRSTVWPYDESGEPREFFYSALRAPDGRRGRARARASSRAATRCSTRRASAPSRRASSPSPGRARRIALAEGAYFGTGVLFGELEPWGLEVVEYDQTGPPPPTRTSSGSRRRRTRSLTAAGLGRRCAPPRPRRLRRDRLDAGLPPGARRGRRRRPALGDEVPDRPARRAARRDDHARRARRERLKLMRVNAGITAAPDAASALLRGLATLETRMRRHTETATELARRLEAHPAVELVRYPGFSGLISFDVADAARGRDVDLADRQRDEPRRRPLLAGEPPPLGGRPHPDGPATALGRARGRRAPLGRPGRRTRPNGPDSELVRPMTLT